MAYDEFLADRIRQVLKDKNVSFAEKKMMKHSQNQDAKKWILLKNR